MRHLQKFNEFYSYDFLETRPEFKSIKFLSKNDIPRVTHPIEEDLKIEMIDGLSDTLDGFDVDFVRGDQHKNYVSFNIVNRKELRKYRGKDLTLEKPDKPFSFMLKVQLAHGGLFKDQFYCELYNTSTVESDETESVYFQSDGFEKLMQDLEQLIHGMTGLDQPTKM